MKAHYFQKVLPKARKVPDSPLVKMGKVSPTYKIKNAFCRDVANALKSAGYVVEGETTTENNTTFGMVRGDEHIIVSDAGKWPFFLGDTTIRIGVMRQFRDAPINLR